MKLWRYDKVLGRYVVLSDAEIKQQIQGKPIETEPALAKHSPLRALKREITLVLAEFKTWWGFGLMLACTLFGFCISMTGLLATAVLLLYIASCTIVSTIAWIGALL